MFLLSPVLEILILVFVHLLALIVIYFLVSLIILLLIPPPPSAPGSVGRQRTIPQEQPFLKFQPLTLVSLFTRKELQTIQDAHNPGIQTYSQRYNLKFS